MEHDDPGDQIVETKKGATEQKDDDIKDRQSTKRNAEASDTNLGSKDLNFDKQQTTTSSGNVESLENNACVSDIACDLDTEDSVYITVGKNNTGDHCKLRCSFVVIWTLLSVLLTLVGLCFHLYGFSSSYWRNDAVSEAHYGLWQYCNGTCYRINTYNNWYFGVQACAVMGVSWSIISGILNIHGLVQGNKTSYVLSLFFYFWACTSILATSILFIYRNVKGYSISASFGVYIAGSVLQLTAVVISIVNVGLKSTFHLIMCRYGGRRKKKQRNQSDKDTATLLDSES